MKTIPPPDGIATPITTQKARRLIEELREWERGVIRAEYQRLRSAGWKKEEALHFLHRAHDRTVDSISHIIYPRS